MLLLDAEEGGRGVTAIIYTAHLPFSLSFNLSVCLDRFGASKAPQNPCTLHKLLFCLSNAAQQGANVITEQMLYIAP